MADEQPQTAAATQQLLLQKIYVKDLSFESPKAPTVFTTNVAPQTQISIRTGSQTIAQNTFEVTLTLTVEAKEQDATIFLIEIAQAGIFYIEGYNTEEQGVLIGTFCPNTLYPFAREAIADVIGRGGFPQFLLQPINFDGLYAQALRERAARGDGQNAAAAPSPGETH
jgi:preprotein translocase subunit SecB